MDITITRIDDRLIHGQIVTAWLANANAQQILIADDAAAKDAFQKSLLEMATPAGVTLQILGVEEAAELIKSDTSKVRTLLLLRGVNEAYALHEAGVPFTEINVGNLNMKKGKKKILNSFWVDQQDVDSFNKLSAAGVALEMRIVPSDRRQDAMNLVKKF